MTISLPLALLGGLGLGAVISLLVYFRLMMRLNRVEQERALIERELSLFKQQQGLAERDLAAARSRAQELEVRSAQLETELRFQQGEAEARHQAFRDAELKMNQIFQANAAEALRQNGETFMQMAHSVLQQHEMKARGELDVRSQAVNQLIEPIHKSLDKVQERMIDLEKQRVGAYQGLHEQVGLLLDAQGRLQLEASKLASAMRSPTARGRWGELQLRRVVELAGMLAYCDFFEQGHLAGEKGLQRPDMIVRLPGKRSIAIDAKVPLQAYLEAIESHDEEERQRLFSQHASLVRRQVQLLGQKSYWDQIEGSPEFVLLFLPGESFFSAALQADPSLLEIGVDHRVLITTPTSLIALLRTSAAVWRQEDMTRNAQEVSRLGRELYQRLADLSAHVADTGKQLGAAVQSYNKMVGTIESRVLVSARRFTELKADDPKKELKETPSVEHLPRSLNMSELEF